VSAGGLLAPASTSGPAAGAAGSSREGAGQPPPRNGLLIAVLVLALLATVMVSVLRGSYRDGPLEPDAPSPQGSLAAVRVLEDLGTDVTPQRRTADAAETLRAGGTVLVTAPNILGSAQIDLLRTAREEGGGRLVLLQPDFVTATAFAPGVRPAGTTDEPTGLQAGADCGPAAFGARSLRLSPVPEVSDHDTYYTVPEGAAGCFDHADGSAVVVADGVVVLGSASLLANDRIGTLDAPALALNSLADPQGLGWYIPSAADPMSSLGPTLLDRIPDWAAPLALWLLAVTVLVLIAASRRHGPVVVEPLPVSVRAHELTIGRGRLMHRAHARDSAARALRSAASARLAHRLGIRRETRRDALVDALAPHTELDAAQLHRLLGPTPVADDRELVRLAHDLDRLEKEISR